MAKMVIENPENLRKWLTSELEPICDADPAALAKYVMALLKKDKPETELKAFCIEQLEVFLQTATRKFVDVLFAAVRDKSYMNASAAPATATTTVTQQPALAVVSATTTAPTANAPQSSAAVIASTTLAQPRSPAATASSSGSGVNRAATKEDSRESRVQKAPIKLRRSPVARSHREPSPSPAARSANVKSSRTVESRHTAPSSKQRRSRSRSPVVPRRRSRSRERRLPSPPPLPAGTESDAATSSAFPQRSLAPERTRASRSASPSVAAAVAGGEKAVPSAAPTTVAATAHAGSAERHKGAGARVNRRRCRDYDEKGYCMRGDQCMFDHGPDPVVVEDMDLPRMIIPAAPPVLASSISMPHPPNLSVPPPGYVPPAQTSGVQSEPYNPEAPALAPAAAAAAGLGLSSQQPSTGATPAGVSAPAAGPYSLPPPPLWSQPPPILGPPAYGVPPSLVGIPGFAGDGRSRQLITLASDDGGYGKRRAEGNGAEGRPPFKRRVQDRLGPMPGQRTGSTLEVRQIPVELNNIAKLNEHFAQFGNIVNIQVRYGGDPQAALITYATYSQAVSAHKSTVPILNNRFVRVFWHNAEATAEGEQQVPTDTAPRERTGQLPPSAYRLNNKAAVGAEPSLAATAERRAELAEGAAAKADASGNVKTILVTQTGGISKTFFNKKALDAAAALQQSKSASGITPAPSLAAPTAGTSAPVAPSSSYGAAPATYEDARQQQQMANQRRMFEQKIRRNDQMRQRMELYKRKTELFTKQVNEQKSVLAQLEKVKDQNQKRELMKLVNALSKSTSSLKEELRELKASLNKPAAVPARAFFSSARSKEQLHRQVLDTELEMLNQKQAGQDTSDLQRKLTELKNEVAAAAARRTSFSATSTPGAGAGGRDEEENTGAASGVGRRACDLKISGFTPSAKDALMKSLELAGEIERCECDDEKQLINAIYKTRRDAEMAFKWLVKTNDFGLLNVTWGRMSESQNVRLSDSGLSAQELLAKLRGDDGDEDESSNDDELDEDDVLALPTSAQDD